MVIDKVIALIQMCRTYIFYHHFLFDKIYGVEDLVKFVVYEQPIAVFKTWFHLQLL